MVNTMIKETSTDMEKAWSKAAVWTEELLCQVGPQAAFVTSSNYEQPIKMQQ